MKTLTKEQIESVVTWMNTWDQLRETAIPMRFMEASGYHSRFGHIQPPLGLRPRLIAEWARVDEISDAMDRYLQARKRVPDEWIKEFTELMDKLR